VKSCDEGSLPFEGGFQAFLDGVSGYGQDVKESTKLFENRLMASFMDKIDAGIDVPNYPQYRDMNQMLFDMIEGIGKIDGGYIETSISTLKEGKKVIPEISVIKSHSQEIYEKLGAPFQLRICIAGPYTISSLFDYKDKGTFDRLGNVLAQMVDANIFNNKYGSVALVSVDEPVFGFIDDPLLDRGSKARENLLNAWDFIMRKIKVKGAQSCIHLHSTSDELFWEVQSLSVIESHLHDSFYQAKRTKEKLESTDKFLKASIATTDFDQLIRDKIMVTSKQKLDEITLNEQIAETWKNIVKKQIDPMFFLENAELMKERLTKVIGFFGENRVPYAGPECGLKGFPTYKSALECLRRLSRAVKAA
jgi:5-methyltetrahydropteroyltriglutamate--homocysteine methyltransferase